MVSTLESGGDESRRMEEGNALGGEGWGISKGRLNTRSIYMETQGQFGRGRGLGPVMPLMYGTK